MNKYTKTINEFTYQLCNNDTDMETVGRLRYECYLNADAITENPEKIFIDKYDGLPNSKSVMIYEHNKIVASLRASIYHPELQYTRAPSLENFKEEVSYHLGLDKVIVDSNRLVINSEKSESKTFFKLPFRFMVLNLQKYNSDYLITAVRKNHAPLYQRYLLMEPISNLKNFPGVNFETILMAGDVKKNLSTILQKEELYNISDEEMAMYPF